MSNRKKITYQYVFVYVNNQLGLTNGLQCKSFMADYEIALTDGFLAIVPGTDVSHCLFHYTQACKRNAQKCNLLQHFMKM